VQLNVRDHAVEMLSDRAASRAGECDAADREREQ
jgi:hypothetical protein